ncbi:unnamed protein product [Cylindrotheca closterium]|uniref:Uncharacterized protein n=1 Tax=Cylindrotheca closterium TaxID=2856 RepID=A0AAD2FRY0_9STRA|nr:unnamed protein product [Cylindrotheca closterium]
MAMTDVAIDSLVYPRSQTPDDEGDFQDDQLALVPLSIRSLIKVIQGYVYYRKHVHNDPVNPDNCMDIDYGSVLDYRASGEFLTFGNRTIPQPIIQKPSRRTPAADEFDRSIRREPSSFPTFSNDKQWENYNCNLAAICRTYGLQNVLNHKYSPQTVDKKDLFDRQQAFMYQVFTTTLLTDKGKQFVHEHQATFDAQKIYNQLAKAYTKSVKADATATGLLRWIMTARLDDSWRNTHESFIIHWQEQVRKYHTLADISQRMPETQQHLLLEQALIAVPYLDEIQRLSRILEMQTGKAIIFDDYVTLVESAAQSYDTWQVSKPKPNTNNPSRDVYFTGVDSGLDDDNLDIKFNIDPDIAPLPDKAKAVILGASSEPAWPSPPPLPPPLPPRRLVNLHDITAAELLDHFQDGSMGSASGALPPEVVDNARDNISGYVTERQSLRPGGANGGIAGDDVTTLSQTNRSVEVRAIDDHQLTDVSIKTLPHIVLTSDKNWDPGVLDSRVDEFDPKPDDGLEDLDPKVDDIDKWTDCITGNGLEGAKSRFDQVDILKRHFIFDEAIFDEAIHFFETFQYSSPFDEPYKDSECTDTGTDCPDTGPDYFEDTLAIDIPSKRRCNTSCKVCFGHGIWPGNGEQPDTGPPQRNKQGHKTLPLADTMVYKNPSSAVKSHERNWERLRQYFAWLPKHSFHCTTTDLARSPTNAHHEHKYRPLSPLPEPISCMVVLVGIAKHDCHDMTNIFLFLETNNVLLPSDICSALPPTGLHKRLVLPDGEELVLPTITKSIDLSDGEELTPPRKIKSRDHKSLKTIVHSSDAESEIEDVLLEEKDLIGQTFLLSPDDEGYVQRAKIVELNYKHNCNTDIQPARIQLCLNIDKGKYEHVMAYHEIHKWSETDKDNPIDTKLKQVVCHHHYI